MVILEVLLMDLENCYCINRQTNSRPFYFKYKNQKVTLITSAPSFQAVYRSLASIRFFRSIFLALLGPYPDINDNSIVNFFLDNIYWTHYHKCYLPNQGYKNPPGYCRNKYLDQELEEYSPELIVLLGQPVVKKLLNRNIGREDWGETTLNGITCVYAEFPKTGCEPEMQFIRKKVKEYIVEVDINTGVEDSLKSIVSGEKDKFAVHVKFEFMALKRYWETVKKFYSKDLFFSKDPGKSIDNMWVNKEVIPRWILNSFIVTCWSFVEDQIQALLAENTNINGSLSPLVKLKAIFREYNKGYLLRERPPIIDDLYLLYNIRNYLVHAGGRIKPMNSEDPQKEEVKRKVYRRIDEKKDLSIEPSGMIIVTESFCNYAVSLVERFTKYITRFNTKY